MDNYWVSEWDWQVAWTANLINQLQNPVELQKWLVNAVKVGEETQAYSIKQIPLLDYTQDNASLPDFLNNYYQDTQTVDLFNFTKSGLVAVNGKHYKATSLLAYYEEAGQVVEAQIDDIGALLRQLKADKLEEAYSSFRYGPALNIIGPSLDFRDPSSIQKFFDRGKVKITISLHSDIWLPWIDGIISDDYDIDYVFDNRQLANRHTPRLNQFLNSLREATLAIGGTWELDEEEIRVPNTLVSSMGIVLDAPAPDFVHK
jgi:hypothetical protein